MHRHQAARCLPASRPVYTSGELHHMSHGCPRRCLENLLTRYLDRSTSTATEASESRNFTATCPALKLIHMSGSGKSSCSADSYKCLYISVTFLLWTPFDSFQLPQGALQSQASESPLPIGCSQVGVLYPQPILPPPHPPQPPIFGAQPLKPGPLARGSLRPQKEALSSPPPPPWLSSTISTELLWGLCQAPTGRGDGASG